MASPIGLKKNSGIWLPGNGCCVNGFIGGAKSDCGEIAAAFGQRRHVRKARDPFADPRPFVIGEKECTVLYNRPAVREAELVPLILGVGLIRRGEIVARVERGVAEEFVDRPVRAVRAGVQNDVDLRPRVTTERRVVGARQHLELSDRVYGRLDPEGVQLRVNVVDAVEQKIVAVFARAVDAESEVSAHAAGRAGRSRDRAGDQQAQFQEVAPVEREPANLAILNHGAERGRIFFQRHGRALRL